MCGINCIIDKNSNLPPHLVGLMNQAIHYRGPDHQNILSENMNHGTIYLGANRLRIADQDPASDQPMFSADRKKVLIFSGEIYNYPDLKKKLIQQGIIFKTESDTEVLLNMLSLKGEEAIHELKGMFAFVFVDFTRNRLIAARDRHGMKPFFYADTPSAFIISSESKAVIASGLTQGKLSEEGIKEYLKYRYINHPRTIYEGIFQLTPGTFISIDLQTHKIEEITFIKTTIIPSPRTAADLISVVEEKIVESLKKHLSSSKPAGLMLSGGVDSSLLLYLARKHDLSLEYFYSAVNKSEDEIYGTRDYEYSKWIAEKFNLPNHSILEFDNRILHELPGQVKMLDLPVGDSAFILTDILSKAASGQVGVLITGAGADEYFAGYNRHMAYKHYLDYYTFFKILAPFNRAIADFLNSGKNHPLRKKYRLARKFLKDLRRDPELTYDNFMSSGVADQEEVFDDSNTGRIPGNRENYLKNALNRDRREYLVNDILLMTDQVTLYNGLEVRSPYLDDDLVETVQNIPPSILMKEGQKWILKKILKNYGMNPIAERPKEGFGLPFGKWIREREFDYLRNDMIDKNNRLFQYVDPSRLNSLMQSHMELKEDNSQSLFSILVLSEWLKTI